jgi:DNA ligase-1
MINEIDFDNNRFEGVMAAGWIRDLESSDSRIHKEKTIEKALMAAKLGSSDAQIFLFNCYQAYNPFYTFNVRQVPETSGLTGRDNPWPVFWALLENLRTRGITGHRARDRIQEVAEQFDSDEWNNLARRVIIKDLRCGISEKTINKVVGNTEWRIPVFSVQLAQDSAGQPKKMKGIKRLEVKLDGVRVVAVVQGDVCTLYSRNGKVFENFPQIAEAIEANRKAFQYGRGTGGNFVLDGEIVGESFQKLMKQAHRKSDAETSGMVYHIFDVLPLDALKEGHWNAKQQSRLDWLDSAKSALEETDNLRIMPGMNVDLDGAEGHDVMHRFAEASVEQGYEGIMIKDLDAPYICKRSDSWMKYKPVHDYDLKVVAVEEGTGKNVGRLGALICEGVDQDKLIRVNVGSGFSDAQRQDYWDHQDEVVGQTAVILCDAITQNQDGGYSLRFPRFKTFRDDK